MNKLAILALTLALVGCAASAPRDPAEVAEEMSQLIGARPSDEEELSLMPPEQKVLGSFCIDARDEFFNFAKEGTYQVTATVFEILFKEIGQITTGVSETTQTGASQTAQELEKVQPGNLLSDLLQGVKTILIEAYSFATNEVKQRINELASKLGTENFKGQVATACGSLEFQFMPKLNQKFSAALTSARAEVPNPESLATVTLQNLQCVSVSRIQRAAKFCKIFNIISSALPMLGL